MSRVDDWNDGWIEGYAAALQDAIDAVYKFVGSADDEQDHDEENSFIKNIIAAIDSPCHHTKYEGCEPCVHDDAATVMHVLRGEPQ